MWFHPAVYQQNIASLPPACSNFLQLFVTGQRPEVYTIYAKTIRIHSLLEIVSESSILSIFHSNPKAQRSDTLLEKFSILKVPQSSM